MRSKREIELDSDEAIREFNGVCSEWRALAAKVYRLDHVASSEEGEKLGALSRERDQLEARIEALRKEWLDAIS